MMLSTAMILGYWVQLAESCSDCFEQQSGQTVEKVCFGSDRLMLMNWKESQVTFICTIQVYFPLTEHSEGEGDSIYETKHLLDTKTKGKNLHCRYGRF